MLENEYLEVKKSVIHACPDQDDDQDELTKTEKKIIKILSKDMGEEIADGLVKSFKFQNTTDLSVSINNHYEKTAKLWAHILIHFVKWAMENAQNKPIKFAMRDGEPFEVIYNILSPNKNDNKIWINRKVCGIQTEDKDCKNATNSPLLLEYIEQEKLNEDFIFVDAGCWGTIIKDLYSNTLLHFKGEPLFFYSHNPHIPSFLSELGISEEFGEVLNDSIESFFPKKFKSVESFEKNPEKKIVPKLEANDDIMRSANDIFNRELEKITRQYKEDKSTLPDISVLIKTLVEKQQLSRDGTFTGVLPKATPGTVNKTTFLKSWPKKLKWTTTKEETCLSK